LADARAWPAIDVRSAAVDTDGEVGGRIVAAVADYAPLAIEDLIAPPLPPGGLWDPTAPPLPEPPPTPIAWRICFPDEAARDGAAVAVTALALDLAVERIAVADDDWVARSQAGLRAVTAGRFIVAPPWDLPDAVPEGQHVVVIEPSMGFGTGHHATTRLCLTALSAVPIDGRSVLDLGTGSGVLALAASLLGARAIRGLDIDPDAIDAARRSAALNQVPAPVAFAVADVLAAPPPPADVVVANLTGAMLIRAASMLAAVVAPSGTLVVSGFTETERDGVERALDRFAVVERLTEDEWRALVLRRR
jgi:ribosomal protein L11 methyltransferase